MADRHLPSRRGAEDSSHGVRTESRPATRTDLLPDRKWRRRRSVQARLYRLPGSSTSEGRGQSRRVDAMRGRGMFQKPPTLGQLQTVDSVPASGADQACPKTDVFGSLGGLMSAGVETNCEPAITAAEACKLLGLKRPGTVLKWAREGKIPCIRLGQGKGAYVRFRASALDAWMRERLHSSALPLASSLEVRQ
jgi:excisionase family DNA binding protein